MSVKAIEAEVSIKSGAQAECTIGREVIVEVHDDVNLESLMVIANGTYEPTEGIDGYDSVTVNVEVPKDPNVIEGEFIGTETGIVTIDTGYEGDDFPKIIEVTPKFGIFSDEFINSVLPYSICAFVTVKKTAIVPLYNGKSSDTYVSAYTYYNGSAFVGNYIASAYVGSQANPDYSGSKVIRCPDNKTIKIFTANENSGEAIFFPCDVVFKYRVVY